MDKSAGNFSKKHCIVWVGIIMTPGSEAPNKNGCLEGQKAGINEISFYQNRFLEKLATLSQMVSFMPMFL